MVPTLPLTGSRVVAIITLLCLTLPSARANTRQKSIEAVSPRIGQQGTTVDVRIIGISVEDPRQIIFDRPGIETIDLADSEIPPGDPGRRNFSGAPRQDVTCRFVIAPDCPPGEHRFRLLTGTELSHLATFHVGRYPVIQEVEDSLQHSNDALENAVPIEMNTTVEGQMDRGSANDRDVYRVPVTNGKRLSVEVESVRIADAHYGDSEFDLMVRVLNEQGKEIARNDDNDYSLQDPVLSIISNYDGFAFIEIKRSIFAPRKSTYCLHVGDFPRPTIAFPPGGPAGETVSVELFGDPTGNLTRSIQLPKQPGGFGLDVGAPSPVPMRVSPYPNLLENKGPKPTEISQIPIAVNGRLSKIGEQDDFRFTAKKDDRLRIRVYAFSLASTIDAKIEIFQLDETGALGEPIFEQDDSSIPDRDIFGTSYRGGTGVGDIIDPSFIWKAKADGDYLLRISDSSRREGVNGIYRIEIEPARTMVITNLASRTFDWTESMRVSGFAVPRGNRWTVNVFLPKGQFDQPTEPFRLIAEGLPPGIEMISPPVVPGNDVWPVQLIAKPDANIGGGLFSFQARQIEPPSEAIETHDQQHVPFINHSGGNAWRRVSTDAYFYGVTEAAPFSIEVGTPELHLVRQATRAIPVKVTRHGDFDGPVLLSVGFVHSAIDKSPDVVVPAGETEGEISLNARSYAPLATLPLVITGSTIHEVINPFLGSGHIRVSSEIVDLTVTQPYLQLAAEPQSIRRDSEGPLVWSVSHLTPFEGEATLTLHGLPKGVEVTSAPTVTPDSREAVFQLTVSPETLLGNITGIECEVTVMVDGAPVRQTAGQASLRIDPAS